MDARQMTAMAEATRLTRQGRLAEATALIQRTLASPAAARRAPDARRTGWFNRRLVPSRSARNLRVPHRPEAAPTGRPAGRFEAHSYANAAGTRAYRLYVPAGHTGSPLPLVVMLHGGSQDAATFAAATGMNDLAERQGFLVAYPEQPSSANPGKYWNWFVLGHQRRDAGEPSLIAAAASREGHPSTKPATVTRGQVHGGYAYTRTYYPGPAGATLAERWAVHQAGHAWSGGAPHGSYTDARGPDASAEFIRFFHEHPAGLSLDPPVNSGSTFPA